MKKLFLTLFTLSLVNMSATAQLNQRPNGDHYLTPDSYGNPIPLDIYYYDSVSGHVAYHNSAGSYAACSPDGYGNCYDVAQPCYSDTLLTIKGVAAFLLYRYYNGMNAYIHIADTTFNVHRTLKIPQGEYENITYFESGDMNYTEMFFEQPINVKGRFMVIWDNPKPNVSNVQYEYDYNYNSQVEYHGHLFASKNIKDIDAIYKFLPYKRLCSNDTLFDWVKECEIEAIFGMTLPASIYYLFPIFGELDTTLECVGCYADSSIDSSDVGLVNNSTVDMYTHIFPNPVKEKLNVQCSFKIENIEVYNILGQKVLDKWVQGYNTTINMSSLTKGSYTLRIKTQSGVVNKKFIVE